MEEKEQEKKVAEMKEMMAETDKLIKALGTIQSIFGITCLCIVIYTLGLIIWALVHFLS